jgi:hypothetical protein
MIFNTTHTNKDYEAECNLMIGSRYTFFEKIKLGGIGSGRLLINTISDKINLGKLKFSEINYGNIELRKKGIIVHFTNKLERFSWIIPYYKLVIYSTDYFSIYSNGNYIRFTKNKNYTENKTFIKRVNELKTNYLSKDYYGN